jgi:hypothetical protein
VGYAWLLIGIGVLCLVFGFPWGSLVGAVFILAGVIAWRKKYARVANVV